MKYIKVWFATDGLAKFDIFKPSPAIYHLYLVSWVYFEIYLRKKIAKPHQNHETISPPPDFFPLTLYSWDYIKSKIFIEKRV